MLALPSPLKLSAPTWLALLSCAAVGCTGSLEGAPGGSASGSSASGGSAAAPNPFGETDPGQLADGVPYTTRVGRLTHKQYDNTTSDLLYLDVALSSEFEADPVFSGYDNSIGDLAVAGRLGRDYRRAAEELSARVVADATALQRISPCQSATPECVAKFVQSFGLRAYRRPLSAEEQAVYTALHASGPKLIGSSDAFKDGVQVVVEAMLQSPSFLYRTELTQAPQPDGFLKLDGYEVAQRLSYMAWNTMPDDALFAAAASGALNEPAGIATELQRLWSDPRAREPVSDFHQQWLQMDRYLDLTRDATKFPAFSSALGAPLQQEATAFINHVVFDLKQGFPTLFSAPFSFVNAQLAPLYGLDATSFGPELEKVQLDPTQRKGLLTQLGFLASHSYPGETSPIHRGVFLYRRILCKTVPDPVGIDTSQGKVENPRTTREAVEIQTGQTGCINCHQLFNPLGFAFEHFDAVGQHRTLDRGNPVDTSGQTSIDAAPVAFQSASELIDAISTSSDARRCYADNWLRYAFGRDSTPADAKTIEQVSTAMSSDAYTLREMLGAIGESKPFRFRAPNFD